MIIRSWNLSWLTARSSLLVGGLSLALLGAWVIGDLLGQPPAPKIRKEEEEKGPKKPKRKIILVEETEKDSSPSKTGSADRTATSNDLAQLAEQATHPGLQELFRSLAVPYDLVLYRPLSVTVNGEPQQRENRPEDKIEPTPLYLGDDPGRFSEEPIRFTPLPVNGKPQKSYSPAILRIASVRPYEKIAQEKVRNFLHRGYDQRDPSDPLYLSRLDMLKAAEQVLSSVLGWHQSAIQTGKRRGKEWDAVEQALRTQLLDEVWLEQIKILARAKEWEKVLDLTHRLTVTYTQDAERERIYRPVADMIRSVLNDPTSTDEERQTACKRLHELEMKFPGNRAFSQFSDLLQSRAESLLRAAQRVAGDKKEPQKIQRARELLSAAEEIWPQLPGLREFKIEIGIEYPILRVGVRGSLPKYFSPAWACTDNERRVVDMLFESLVKLVPDEAGGFSYRPGLAESLPKVVPLGRQFDLPRNAFWSDGGRLNFNDIDSSLKLLQIGQGLGRSRLWGDLLFTVEQMREPYQVTLWLKQGLLDPLAPMTFKILPSEPRPVLSEEFARNPVTSGPFRLGRLQSDEKRREYLPFVANLAYGQRPTKRGMPHIQEVRLYVYTDNTNVAEELRNDRLDLVLDLTAQQAEELKKQPDIMVPFPSPANLNRRIYFLAINTHKLEEATLRQALSCAIDREGLLNKYFRASSKTLHKALNGPFPAGCWCNPGKPDNKSGQNLFDPDRAKFLSQQKAVLDAVKAGPFKLKYAVDHPALEEALKDLCVQVRERTGVTLELTPLSPYQLREDVEQTRNYDLAYYHYDFPDQSYWLAPLLGPPPGIDKDRDINIFNFHDPSLTKLLEGMKNYRNFAEVRRYQAAIYELLNRELPFIPLWQLDPLLAYRRDVQPPALDPLYVFSNIEEWRLQRK